MSDAPHRADACHGDGRRLLYLDEDIRILESTTDSPDKWESAGLVVVQVRDGCFDDAGQTPIG